MGGGCFYFGAREQSKLSKERELTFVAITMFKDASGLEQEEEEEEVAEPEQLPGRTPPIPLSSSSSFTLVRARLTPMLSY